MAGPHYFAWLDAPVAFNAAVHNVEDEQILSVRLSQEETGFASLEIEMANPSQGLLAPGRELWCWYSWDEDGDGTPTAMFTGRVIGVTRNLHLDTATLQFIAQPPDYEGDKATSAAALKSPPYWDPVWLAADTDDADAVLETRSAIWHTDRTTLAVTTTDILEGEAGTIALGEDVLLYDATEITYGEPPLSKVEIEATVSWTQAGSGSVDLSRDIYDGFNQIGQVYPFPTIASLTGDGLAADWPREGQSIGGGWTVGAGTEATEAGHVQAYVFAVSYFAQAPEEGADEGAASTYFAEYHKFDLRFPVYRYKVTFIADYAASRDRTEKITFTLNADLQPMLGQLPGADTEKIVLGSDLLESIIDGGDETPIRDVRRKSYFNTDRGKQSVEHLILRARARLRARSRAVRVTVQAASWSGLTGISCRHNVTVTDRRLPGGTATGKVVSYTLICSAETGQYAEIVIGCAIGCGGTVTAATGTGVYAADGYMQAGYQQMTGAQVQLVSDEVAYQVLDAFAISDDGIDLFNMDPDTVLNSITVTDALRDQTERVRRTPDPLYALTLHPTRICVDLKPVTGKFHTDYTPTIETLPIPQQIDLEAA